MKLDIKVSVNTDEIFKDKENDDLSMVKIPWKNQATITISNPFVMSTSQIIKESLK